MSTTDERSNGAEPALEALPAVVNMSAAASRRLPSQRLLDMLAHLEPGVPFQELTETQPFRVQAFRALLRDYPHRDPASLWMHAYECEVDIPDLDPTNGASPTTVSPPSVTTGIASPTTSSE